ncbi:MAG TPA: triose-phosphate isomerase [Quisquiliibacterium sp.]|nr:triose-phosphate isomerase [Quisquiliibacterium sp.]
MKPRKPLVVGNWKMNGDLVANERLFTALRSSIDRGLLAQVDVAVCPPYPYLGQAAAWLGDTGIAWGAQDVASFENGAFTGEVSAAMVSDLGCRWAIVGHSERRTLLGETDEVVAQKARRALDHDVGVIVCVGETLEERERGAEEAVLGRQLDALSSLSGASADRFVLAYEPVWAIGTGRTATPEQAQSMHAFIRGRLASGGFGEAARVRILYGGSVKAANAGSLFGMADIDGGLIGGAALVAEDFGAICRSAALA